MVDEVTNIKIDPMYYQTPNVGTYRFSSAPAAATTFRGATLGNFTTTDLSST